MNAEADDVVVVRLLRRSGVLPCRKFFRRYERYAAIGTNKICCSDTNLEFVKFQWEAYAVEFGTQNGVCSILLLLPQNKSFKLSSKISIDVIIGEMCLSLVAILQE